jgi:predicted Zn-dependent protease
VLAREALEIKPQDPYYLDTLGWAQFKAGKLEEAEATLAKAVGQAGDDLVVVDHYVEVLIARKKYEQAVALMKGVVERDFTKEEKEDADTIGAYERIQKRLKTILKEQPQLAGVEKSALRKRPKSSSLPEADELFGEMDPTRPSNHLSFDIEQVAGSRP